MWSDFRAQIWAHKQSLYDSRRQPCATCTGPHQHAHRPSKITRDFNIHLFILQMDSSVYTRRVCCLKQRLHQAWSSAEHSPACIYSCGYAEQYLRKSRVQEADVDAACGLPFHFWACELSHQCCGSCKVALSAQCVVIRVRSSSAASTGRQKHCTLYA
jgi:hypothetical protein